MVLNNYFNALYKDTRDIKSYNSSGNEIKVQAYVLPSLSLRENDPDERANTIFPTDFQTGDILIYTNENDIVYSTGKNITVTGYSGPSTKETYITYENGEYAYIYIDGKFVGVNSGNDLMETKDDRNEFTLSYYTENNLSGYKTSAYITSLKTGFGNINMPDGGEEWLQYQSLFGKNAYVILRPSLAIRSLNYELNGGTNNTGNSTAFILGRDIELKDPTREGFAFQGWYTDSEYTNQVNNVNELTDDTVLYAKWDCEEGFHLDGDTCVSNSKKEDCNPGTIANGSYTVEKVDVIWNTSTNDWNSIPSCTNFTCNENYHKDGSSCRANTDLNGNGIADEEEPHHNLTIRYVDSKNRTVFDDYTASIVQGAAYTVTSQKKLHYIADTPIVSGIMGNTDVFVTVRYNTATADTNNNGIADEDENKYTLTINYVYSRGGEVSESISGEYLEGISYSIASPVVIYYSADVEVAEGIMSGEDRTIIVTYTPVNDRNKNGTADEEEKTNYSGGGRRGGSSKSNANSNVDLNQHGSADENPEKVKENEKQDNETIKIVENSTKVQNDRNGTAVEQAIISNNPKYTKEFNQAYQFAYNNGLTNKSDIADAKMGRKITRIQMAKMLSYFAINVLGKKPDLSRKANFVDMTEELDKEYGNAATLAYQLGIMGINTRGNHFWPKDEVTRAEFVTALSRMLYGIEDGKGKVKYYRPHMVKLYQEGIISKTNPSMIEKRGYVMLMLMRSIINW